MSGGKSSVLRGEIRWYTFALPDKRRPVLVLSRDASDFSVSVRDNGSGIAEGDLVKVFEPFVRASHGVAGLGVGLYVARTLVEQHGGAISVTSAGAGQGAIFIVRLPELSPLFRDEGSLTLP